MSAKENIMSQILLYPICFKQILQYRIWGGRNFADLLFAPLSGNDPIGEARVVLKSIAENHFITGLSPGLTAENLRQSITKGAIEDYHIYFIPTPSDVVFLSAVIVHTLVDDIEVFEFQRNSDFTFRLFNWNHSDDQTSQPLALQIDQVNICIDFVQGVASSKESATVPEIVLRDLIKKYYKCKIKKTEKNSY